MKASTGKSTVIEIDVSKPKLLKKALEKASDMKIPKLDCYPLLWCQQEKVSLKWTVQIKQRVACKYYVLKLLSRAPGSSTYDANLDMYPIEFQGYKLPIPSFGSSELTKWPINKKNSPLVKPKSGCKMPNEINM